MSRSVIDTYSETIATARSQSGTSVSVHAMWLRDACSCERCRRSTTNERLLDPSSIADDIVIRSIEQDGQRVRVVLSDGHVSEIDADWLGGHVDAIASSDDPARDRNLSTGSKHQVLDSDRADLDTEAGLHRWLDAVISDGVAVLREVEPTDAGLRGVAALIGEIQPTNYGVTWAIEADVEPVSAVDSERALAVHTDLPYRDEAPGLQLLLASVVDVAGGATTLVDGFAVAEEIRRTDPEAWALLTTVDFSYPFLRDDVEIVGRAPLIALATDGTYRQIRRAPDLVGVPFIRSAIDAPRLYRAVRTWSAAIDDPANEMQVALAPGDLVAFDNHRMLHGRTAFELGTAGRRLLLGCYLALDDARSRRAIAARHLAP